MDETKELIKGIDCKERSWYRVKLKSNMINYTNKRFGRLVALFPIKIENQTKHEVSWLCKCDCGNFTCVRGRHLRDKQIISCGCYHKERISELFSLDLTGKRFGKLIVINFIGKVNAHGEKLYKCQCDCNNIAIVATGKLRNGDTKSCGCLNSYQELQIIQLLNQYRIDFVQQYSFPDLIAISRPARFDFAIMKQNKLFGLIEYNGIQHYIDKGDFGKVQREITDKKKNEYCKQYNIPLLILNKESNITQEILDFINQREG